MPRYIVPVTYEMSGCIYVSAKNKADAIRKAKKLYSQKGRDSIDFPCVDVDFAFGESEYEVEIEPKKDV